MRYPESNDPEVLRFHRMRAALGATVVVFLVTGLGAVMVTLPPRASQVSVNCIPAEVSDAPSASATTDDPPIATF